MKQVLQNLKSGKTYLAEAPVPRCQPGCVLIQTHKSLVSTGTERMVVEFGRSNLLQKALQQPDKVKQVLTKIKTDGLLPTIEAVRNQLDHPIALGYCNVGTVLAVADDVTDLKPGDRVVSNGYHAEIVSVKRNLCAKVPEQVSDEEACFTVVCSIALQGIRLTAPTLGETFVVMGLGLIGLITVQLLRAHGCKVIGIDLDQTKLDIARSFGAEIINLKECADPVSLTQNLTNHLGVDGVIITAATDSNEPVHQAATMCRKRGRIVLVGVVGLQLSRADFYQKELTFQVSCSYGPGRYDTNYEGKGLDYPIGFVRWTENRNFCAILDMMADNRLRVSPLITHRFSIDEAEKAYNALIADRPMGIVLNYPQVDLSATDLVKLKTVIVTPEIELAAIAHVPAAPVIGFIGAGGYANNVLIPCFKKTDAVLKSVVTNSSMSSYAAAKRHKIHQASCDIQQIWNDEKINTMVIATRHDSHAELVLNSLQKGKHVFVEKPLALSLQQVDAIEKVYAKTPNKLLMVGFNRRFSPLTQKIKSLLQTSAEPKSFIMTVNAGFLPSDHWTQDLQLGGGRMIGEGCHFVDLLRYLADSPISGFQVQALQAKNRDTFSVTLSFFNGSMGTIHYFANGNRALAKERLEVYCQGKILLLDNFKSLRGYGWSSFKQKKLWQQNKGQRECVQAFVQAIKKGLPSPIPLSEILEVSKVTIKIGNKLSALEL